MNRFGSRSEYLSDFFSRVSSQKHASEKVYLLLALLCEACRLLLDAVPVSQTSEVLSDSQQRVLRRRNRGWHNPARFLCSSACPLYPRPVCPVQKLAAPRF